MYIIHRQPELIVPISTRDCIAGFFKMDAVKDDGRVRPLVDWQPNLITDAGMDYLGNAQKTGSLWGGNGWIDYCRVGTGSNPEAFTDTAMHVHKAEVVGASFTNGAANASPPYFRWQRNIYSYAQGATTGSLTEIGLGKKISNGNLSTRALIKDSGGTPISIVVGATEQLTVTYEIRTYIPSVSVIDEQITIAGVLYDTKRLPCDIDSANNMNGNFLRGAGPTSTLVYQGTTLPNIGTHTTEPVNSMGAATTVLSAYTLGNYYLDATIVLPYTDFHWGSRGVTAVKQQGNMSHWQQSYTQNLAPTWGIPHNNTNELTLVFRYSWARYTP